MAEVSNQVSYNLIVIMSTLINYPDGGKESMRCMERKGAWERGVETISNIWPLPEVQGVVSCILIAALWRLQIIYNTPEIGHFLPSRHNRTCHLPLCVGFTIRKQQCVYRRRVSYLSAAALVHLVRHSRTTQTVGHPCFRSTQGPINQNSNIIQNE